MITIRHNKKRSPSVFEGERFVYKMEGDFIFLPYFLILHPMPIRRKSISSNHTTKINVRFYYPPEKIKMFETVPLEVFFLPLPMKIQKYPRAKKGPSCAL